ncbi:MAG: HDOD domain-containing protein [Zoogloeaceae bacterium]|jgi:putative nucleotidyltransferase with HDIG domain|nr:HDOD domain-containing protein [Zoogloeaceae bacterium]
MMDKSIHFQLLESVAKDLSGDVNFPTCFDATIRIRKVISDPMASADRIAAAISIEPMVVMRLLKLANSVLYNPSGRITTDVREAVWRVGLSTVCTIAMGVAAEQLSHSKELAPFADIAHATWEHSIKVAAIAKALARHLGTVNSDDAMLAGMVHDIGVFYLLYRAAGFTDYQENRKALLDLVIGWHESIGESLLAVLGMPERIVEAVRDHDQIHEVPNPETLADVLYLSNLLGGGQFEWLGVEMEATSNEALANAQARFSKPLEEAMGDIQEIRLALGASL